jgi:sensor histidine kinase regulating citrate/malate metabolism
LLRHILTNILKNAFEATSNGETIEIGLDQVSNYKFITIWVQNPGYIPREVQLQIFYRFFSTKGANRGIGTYAMKLMAKTLGGDVTFTSDINKGTTFMVKIPNMSLKK